MNWNELTEESQLDELKKLSNEQAVLIFKHSTRCSISASALDRMERKWEKEVNIKPYYLDLIRYRPISNRIQDEFTVEHQSPQILLIKNGKCIYNASHIEINFEEIKGNLL
jgi:bacillithiol system protein YtxJ